MAGIWALMLEFDSMARDLGTLCWEKVLKAKRMVFRLKFRPWLEFGPRSWDVGLEARIWASKMGFWPQGCDFDLEAEISASRPGFGSQG